MEKSPVRKETEEEDEAKKVKSTQKTIASFFSTGTNKTPNSKKKLVLSPPPPQMINVIDLTTKDVEQKQEEEEKQDSQEEKQEIVEEKTASIWEEFLLDETKNEVSCNHCQFTMKKGRPTKLLNHILAKCKKAAIDIQLKYKKPVEQAVAKPKKRKKRKQTNVSQEKPLSGVAKATTSIPVKKKHKVEVRREKKEEMKVVPEDPRVAVYQGKLDELASLNQSIDLTLNPWMDVSSDFMLELHTDEEFLKKNAQLLLDFYTHKDEIAMVWPEGLKPLLGRLVQGRREGLSVIVDDVCRFCLHLMSTYWPSFEAMKNNIVVPGTEAKLEENEFFTFFKKALIIPCLEMEIKMLAQRVCYGIKLNTVNLYEDETIGSFWFWEVGNISLVFSPNSMNIIKTNRKNRKRIGIHLKVLGRLIQLLTYGVYDEKLQKKKIDESKISVEESKWSKFQLTNELSKQKIVLQEEKLQEKMKKQEEKLKKQEERHKMLQEISEKKKLKEEELAHQHELKKRQSLFSFFNNPQPKQSMANEVICVDEIEPADNNDLSEKQRKMEMQLHWMTRKDSVEKNIVIPISCSLSCYKLSQKKKKKKKVENCVVDLTNDSCTKNGLDNAINAKKKLLQFYDNYYRPPYFGTWSLKSLKQVSSKKLARKPTSKKVSAVDYSQDSEDEWEEEEEIGESLSGQESGDENINNEEDDLDYNDRWLAYEDEIDYDEEKRKIDDDDEDDGHDDKKPSKKITYKSSVNKHRKKTQQMVPIIVEYKEGENEDLMKEFEIETLCSPKFLPEKDKIAPSPPDLSPIRKEATTPAVASEVKKRKRKEETIPTPSSISSAPVSTPIKKITTFFMKQPSPPAVQLPSKAN